jgi:hypothetical protein
MRNPSVRDIVDIGTFQHSLVLPCSFFDAGGRQDISYLASPNSPGKPPQLWCGTQYSCARFGPT